MRKTLPMMTTINYSTIAGNIGIYVFVTGVILYFFTWICLMIYPNSRWSKSLPGFCEPAYTPIVWLIGFAFLVSKFNFNVHYSIWYYIVPSIIFVLFHGIHSVLAFGNQKH